MAGKMALIGKIYPREIESSPCYHAGLKDRDAVCYHLMFLQCFYLLLENAPKCAQMYLFPLRLNISQNCSILDINLISVSPAKNSPLQFCPN